MPRRNSPGPPDLPSHGTWHQPDQLIAITFAMAAEAAFINRLADDRERRR